MRDSILKATRIVLKQTNSTGDIGTIPSTDDHTDGSWHMTDLYTGEMMLNTVDNKLYIRVNPTTIALIPTAGSIGSEVFTTKVYVPSANILTLNSAPFVVVPAVAGYAIDVISATGQITGGTDFYSSHTEIQLINNGATDFQFNDQKLIHSATSRALKFIQYNNNPGSTDTQHINNTNLILYAPGGNPTGGNTNLNLFVTYKLIALS